MSQDFAKAGVKAVNDIGSPVSLAATGEGHLEVAIHAPRLPFGSIHAERLTPVFQHDAVYQLNSFSTKATTGHSTGGVSSATATVSNNLFKCYTGTTALSFSAIQSRKRLRYRAGQGIVGRFAGGFSAPAESSILVIGFGTAESGFYFGYNGTSFGILHVTGGVREVRTLTVTTASTSTSNYNVVLNGATAVNVTATNNSSTVKTAYEISRGTFPGWTSYQVGSTVVFVANDAGSKTGSYSLAQSGAGTPAAGTFARTLSGAASTDTWIPQSSWNGDKLNGTGASGFTIDPSKGNVFQIGVQYLGFGTITFSVEVTSSNTNNADFVTCHTIKYPNTSTSTSLTQPSFPFTMAAYSAGSTTDVGCFVGSFGGFREGVTLLSGPRMTYTNTSTAVSTGAYYCLFTVRNDGVYAGRANQSVVNILSVGAAHDDATPVTLYALRNATLVGTPNFTAWASSSCTSVDTAATTATVSTNDQIVFSIPIGQGGNELIALGDEVTLQPGETLTIAATAVTGTATYTIASMNTREDQ